MEVSVVIPCYNSYKLMNKCLASLENQTFKDFEVICIDDCSIDNTYECLLNYKKNSKLNMEIYKNEKNLGAGVSRNVGIEKCIGKYIVFLDSDDYLESNTFQLLRPLMANNIDCILFDYYFENSHSQIKRKILSVGNEGIISKRNALIYSAGGTCCKIYKREIIQNNNVRFLNLVRNEDMPFNKIALKYCNSIYYIEKYLYHYFQHNNSLMSNSKLTSEKNAMEAFSVIREILGEEYSYEVNVIFIKEVIYPSILIMTLNNESKDKILEYINKFDQYYPDWYKNEEVKNLSRLQKVTLWCINNRKLKLIKIICGIKSGFSYMIRNLAKINIEN